MTSTAFKLVVLKLGMGTLKRHLSDKKVQKSLFRILESNRLCSMSTVTRKNKAHINIGYFAYRAKTKLEIFYLSYPDSLHSKNLLSNTTMGMTICDSKQEWGGHDRGVQLIGTCREAKGSLYHRAESVYDKRFNKYARWKEEFAKEKRGTFPMRFYRFVPRRAMLVDETVKEFGDSLVLLSFPK
jgi:uncharacterized protein YhbP (UPF0306 family)